MPKLKLTKPQPVAGLAPLLTTKEAAKIVGLSASYLHNDRYVAKQEGTNPLKSRLVAATMRGLGRVHGKPQRAVEPLLIEHLRQILDGLPATTIGRRDAALLTIGFAGGMRRSELVALDFNDIVHVTAGIRITITRSKTDQSGHGRLIAIPIGRTRYCPIRYLKAWVGELDKKEGAVFRSCTKGGKPRGQRLSAEAVAVIVKRHTA